MKKLIFASVLVLSMCGCSNSVSFDYNKINGYFYVTNDSEGYYVVILNKNNDIVVLTHPMTLNDAAKLSDKLNLEMPDSIKPAPNHY